MDLEWRALAAADAAQVGKLVAAVEAVDQEGETFGEADWADELAKPAIDAEKGAFGAFAGPALVAFSVIYAQDEIEQTHQFEQTHQLDLWGAVHPEYRGLGIGTTLLERSTSAALAISAARFPGVPAELSCSVCDRLAGSTELFENSGFIADHYEFSMERALGDADAHTQPPLPAGFTLVPLAGCTPELSAEFRETHNAALVPDLPDTSPATAESWAALVESGNTRLDLSFGLREPSGVLTGYLLAREYGATGDDDSSTTRDEAEDSSRRLYVNFIGTRREFRGRGIASALLAVTAQAAAAQGFSSLTLTVLAENPSWAVDVYLKSGFKVAQRFVVYVRALS